VGRRRLDETDAARHGFRALFDDGTAEVCEVSDPGEWQSILNR
jgi:hypothetical protein